MAASFASSGLRGGQGSDQAGSQGEGADSGAYSPFSNPFGERPPLRTSAGYAVRLSASDLPTPGSFTPMGQSGSCGTPLSPPSWAAQQQHARSPGNMTPQSPHGGSNILAGMGVCDESGTPIESMRRNWFVSDDGDGMGSSTKVVNNAVFEFQPGDQEPNSAASPDMGFAAAAARAGLTPTAESWLSHGQASPSEVTSCGEPEARTGQRSPHSHQIEARTSLTPSEDSGASPRDEAQGSDSHSADSHGDSRSSASELRRERLQAMHSPSELLRQAAKVVRSQAAVGGSSHLRRKAASLPFATPMDKGIPPGAPQTTPITPGSDAADSSMASDAADQQGTDQAAPGTPTSKSAGGAAQGASPVPRSPGSKQQQRSEHDAADDTKTDVEGLARKVVSPESVVSIGSHCGGAQALASGSPISASPCRDLNLGTPAVGGAPSLGSPWFRPSGEAAGGGSPHTPVAPVGVVEGQPFAEFINSLGDSVTKRHARRILMDEDLPATPKSGASGCGESFDDSFAGGQQQADAQLGEVDSGTGQRRRQRTGNILAGPWRVALLVAAAVGIALLALGSTVWLAPSLQQPAIYCTADNAAACASMYRAYFEASDQAGQLNPMKRAALHVKWWLQDAWGLYRHGRMPVGTEGECAPFPDLPIAVQRALQAEEAAREEAVQATGAGAAQVAAEPAAAAKAPAVAAWQPLKLADSCPAWLPVYHMQQSFPDCGPSLLPHQRQLATNEDFAAFNELQACQVPSLQQQTVCAADVMLRAASVQGAASSFGQSIPKGLLMAAAVGGGALMVVGLVAVIVAAYQHIQASAANHDTRTELEQLMGDVGEQPMMQPTPPPAPVVTIAARILTPLLKPPAPVLEGAALSDDEGAALSDDEPASPPRRASLARGRRSVGTASTARRTRVQAQAAADEAGGGELLAVLASHASGSRAGRGLLATPRAARGMPTLEEGKAADVGQLEAEERTEEATAPTTGRAKRGSAAAARRNSASAGGSGAALDEAEATPARRTTRGRRASAQ